MNNSPASIFTMEDAADEDYDCFDQQLLPPNSCSGTDEIFQRILEEEKQNPCKFVSAWELDENDIEETTEEEKKNDPVKRVLWAAETANIDILREMLNTDAGLMNARDADGYTPLHRASYEGHAYAVEFLLSNGARVENVTNDGWTSLHSAANWGQTQVAAILLHHGADINAQTEGLQTPLHLAAVSNTNADILQLLLMNEFVNTELRNKVGETARDVAERSNRFHRLFEMTDRHINTLHTSE